MSEHLTQEQGEGYRQQKLSATELLSVSDHLGACESCRRQVASAVGGGDPAFFALRAEVFGDSPDAGSLMREHPTLDQTAGYVDGMLSGEELQVVTDHLTSCEHCSVVVDDLHAFKSQIVTDLNHEYRPAPVSDPKRGWRQRVVASLPSLFQRSPALAFGTAMVLLLLTVSGWLIWRTIPQPEKKQEAIVTPPPPPAPNPSIDNPAPAVIAQLTDGGAAISLDQQGKLSGADHLPPAYQRMVKDAFSNPRLEKSPLLVGMARPSSSLMSGDKQADTFSVIDPVGIVLLSARPTFRWTRLEGATGYVVEIYDSRFNLVAASPQLTGNSWESQPLKRGGVYGWQVKAIKGGQEFKSPSPPAPQAKFRILDTGKAHELVQARRRYGSSHLLLGLLYARAGLVDEAQQEFRALQKANPDSTIGRRLLENVRH